jgi:hypothetical protein
MSTVVTAAGLELTNTNYNIIDSKSDVTKQYYNIFVTIKNTDNIAFENITIEIIDEWDIPTRQTYDFQPQEQKIFTFEDFPLAGGTTHELTINFYPTNTSLQNSANSGTTSLIVTYEQKSSQNETPFIPPIFLIIIMISVTIILRKKE